MATYHLNLKGYEASPSIFHRVAPGLRGQLSTYVGRRIGWTLALRSQNWKVEVEALLKNVKVWQTLVVGLLLIIVGNAFELAIVRVRIHELLVNVGALLVVVGSLQFAFDEHARELLVSRIEKVISSSEFMLRAGIDQVTDRSHSIAENRQELVDPEHLTIGMHHSNTAVDRYTEIIRDRIAAGKKTTLVVADESGPGLAYLQEMMGDKVDLKQSVLKLTEFVKRNFEESPLVVLKRTKWLLKYNFVATERFIWVVISPTSPGRVARVPAVRSYHGSPVFTYFHRDINEVIQGAS